MTRLSSSRLSIRSKIGNKTAFQQARILSRQALSRINLVNKRIPVTKNYNRRLASFEWSSLIFTIDKALSRLTCPHM